MSLLGRLLNLDLLEKEYMPTIRADAKFMEVVRNELQWIVRKEGIVKPDEAVVARAIKEAMIQDLLFCRTGVPWKRFKIGDLLGLGVSMDRCREEIETMRATNVNDLYLEREKFKSVGTISHLYKRYER